MTFVLEDGSLDAHKAIISARIPLIKKSVYENSHIEVFKNEPKDVIALLLEWVYCGSISSFRENPSDSRAAWKICTFALHLLQIADKYKLSGLTDECSVLLTSMMPLGFLPYVWKWLAESCGATCVSLPALSPNSPATLPVLPENPPEQKSTELLNKNIPKLYKFLANFTIRYTTYTQ